MLQFFINYSTLKIGAGIATKRLSVDLGVINNLYSIQIRSMLSGRSLHALTNQDVIDNSTRANHQFIAKDLVYLSLDHSKGVVQHKTTLLKHITNHKFPTDDIYIPYTTSCNVPKITWEPHIHTDVSS